MVGIIISYCSLESIFIEPLIKECLKFSENIVVSYANCLYDGTPEDETSISALKRKFPAVKFVKYKVTKGERKKGVVNRPTSFLHNEARWTAMRALQPCSWVFVIDSDEIPEGYRVGKWLKQVKLDDNCCYKLGCYYYFRSATLRARQTEDSILLMHAKYLTEDNIYHDDERDGLIRNSRCRLIRDVRGDDGLPMWHHFSHVRTREGLLKKYMCWGHRDDMFQKVDVKKIVDLIYSDDGLVHDVVHGYTYDVVEDTFKIGV